MKSICAILLLFFGLNALYAQSNKEYVPGLAIIKLKPAYRSAFKDGRLMEESLQRVCAEAGLLGLRPVFPHHESRAGAKLDLSLLYELEFENKTSIPILCKRLMATGKLAYAEPRYYFRSDNWIAPEPKVNCGNDKTGEKMNFIPNDSLYNQQMAYLSKIHAPEAWDIEQGDSSVVIGIVDTGVDFLHPDMNNNLALNTADPINGSDDDSNGYLDDYYGWDFADNDNDPSIPIPNVDLHHGTWVASAAAASSNNGIGIAAPGFNCRYLPVKMADSTGALVSLEGIVYAADRGAKVINCSWGGGAPTQFLADIIEYAVMDKDALVVCSGGNAGIELENFPASYEYAMSVAATGTDDKKADYSSYYHSMDISSPAGSLVIRPGGIYASGLDGTSLCSPLVAGAAALVRSHFPNLNALQTGERLRMTADPVDNLNPNYVEKIGKGRLNILRALTEMNVQAVRFRDVQFTDNNDDIFRPGDTVRISGNFVNYLDPTTDLLCTMSSPLSGIKMLQKTFWVGQMATLEEKSNANFPFSFIITEEMGYDVALSLRIAFNDGNYADWQWIKSRSRINISYTDISNDQISSTSNSAGRFGYMYDNNEAGIGFHFLPADSIEFRMTALMIGNNVARVSDGAYNNFPVFDKDFQVVEPIHKVFNSPLADQVYACAFNDSLIVGASRMGLEIHQEIYLWDGDKFLISEYQISNKSNNTYNTLYVGLMDEANIGRYDQNRGDQDSSLGLAYIRSATGTELVAGVQLLNNTSYSHYAYENNSTYNGINPGDGFNSSEKYKILSTNRPQAGYGDVDGEDCGQVVSTGPFQLAPGQTIKVAFAVLAGNHVTDLQTSALKALMRYNGLTTSTHLPEKQGNNFQVFPNPSTGMIYFSSGSENNQCASFARVYDLTGKMMLEKALSGTSGSVDLTSLPNGLYWLRFGNQMRNQVISVIKR